MIHTDVVDSSAWYWKNHPFKVEPVGPSHDQMGYTHKVTGANGLGALFRNEADAHRVAEQWNERAALYCMAEMP